MIAELDHQMRVVLVVAIQRGVARGGGAFPSTTQQALSVPLLGELNEPLLGEDGEQIKSEGI